MVNAYPRQWSVGFLIRDAPGSFRIRKITKEREHSNEKFNRI